MANRASIYRAIESLQQLSSLVERRRRQLARAVGLSDQQWRVLEGISTEHFMPSLFARDTEVSPAALSRTLRQLQEQGLVRVAISADDARQRDYSLTAKGRRSIERLRAARERALGAVWQDFETAEVEAFAGFSGLLSERLAAYAASIEGE